MEQPGATRPCQNSECVIMCDVKSDFTAEDAEVFAKDAEKYCPLRTSASASASSAVKRVLSLASCSSFDTDSTAPGSVSGPSFTVSYHFGRAASRTKRV